jgi:hypothetical protein
MQIGCGGNSNCNSDNPNSGNWWQLRQRLLCAYELEIGDPNLKLGTAPFFDGQVFVR